MSDQERNPKVKVTPGKSLMIGLILATIALFELVSRWNQFLPVILYISDTSKYRLQVTLQALVTKSIGTSGTSKITPNVRMAGIVIAILPLVALYPFIQKYFVQGITLGSVKE